MEIFTGQNVIIDYTQNTAMKSLLKKFLDPSISHRWHLSGLLFSTVCCDQICKYLARKVLTTTGELQFFDGWIKFSLVENYGGFLGIVNNYSPLVRFFFLNICVAVLLCGCLFLLWRGARNRSCGYIPLIFITGGGFSNLLDRLVGDGGVTDFVSLGTGYLQTGIFNLADVFILFGSFSLGFQVFRQDANRS